MAGPSGGGMFAQPKSKNGARSDEFAVRNARPARQQEVLRWLPVLLGRMGMRGFLAGLPPTLASDQSHAILSQCYSQNVSVSQTCAKFAVPDVGFQNSKSVYRFPKPSSELRDLATNWPYARFG